MSRFQRPSKGKALPVGETVTLHSFFGSASRPTPTRTPPKSAEIIIIGSDDENINTSPTQHKRKALASFDPESLPSGSKKGKIISGSAKSVTEDDSPLKSVPLSSLNRAITLVDTTQTNGTQKMLNLVGDWEMGDDELLDIVDDSRVVDDNEDSLENALDTCPACGAIFVDFCLSVSPLPSHSICSIFMPPCLATTSTRECLYRWPTDEKVTWKRYAIWHSWSQGFQHLLSLQ